MGLKPIGLCQDCHKAFENETKPEHVYCGHYRAVAYRHNGQVDIRAVKSTDEATQFIQGFANPVELQAKSA